ncbi:hypothetical protein PCE31107_00185 [Pandoraea cepalis]|uniref:Uncharacterized protein n=1 Tax=Pandoraea cepalis TaxID=2508294 RepID=A0A5E4RI97_9BURK|nr:hypothetical protein PCE31107_00185 [Pandoraea cepalis]
MRPHRANSVQAMSVPVASTQARRTSIRVAVTAAYGAPISHEVKCHTECCNRTARFRYPTQSPVAPASYANPYAAYKLRAYHGAKSRVSERPEKDYTQGLI